MVLWSTRECLIASLVYNQSYQTAKYKIGHNGKLQATKSNGTVTAFYKELVDKLREEGYNRTVEAIKGKEKDFIGWATKLAQFIAQSGNGCMDEKHYTIVTPASLEEEDSAKAIIENFHGAFNGTPKEKPEYNDTGDDTDELSIVSVKARKEANKTSANESQASLQTYIGLKIRKERETSSDIYETDDADMRAFKKQKLTKQLEFQDANTKEKQSIVYMNLKKGGMADDLALELSGLGGMNTITESTVLPDTTS